MAALACGSLPRMTQPPNMPLAIDMNVPPELEAGVYANFAGLWQTPTEFVLDFASVIRPPIQAQDDNGNPIAVLPSKLVARVRVPPAQMFELMKACEQQLTAFEAQHGTISGPPRPPMYPPDGMGDTDNGGGQ